MGSWTGLIYNEGLSLNDSRDWLEIARLNLGGTPEDLVVNDYEADNAPTQSFVRLIQGTSAAPSNSQCRQIPSSGVDNGTIIILKGITGAYISMVHPTGNLHLATGNFALTSYSTMILACIGSQFWEISRSDNN